ncbi:S4 domain-containing protein, partial [Streptomyces sp. G35A]
MWRYFELLSFRSVEEVDQFRRDVEGGANPRDIKIKLAEEIVERFHGAEAAAAAHRSAGNRLQAGEVPADLPDVELVSEEPMPVAAVLNQAGLAKNAAVARDLLRSGGVRVDGHVVDRDFRFELDRWYVCQVGKRSFARVSLRRAVLKD